MRPHIAIFSCPAPALFYPTLSVVKAMVRRGYRVTYVTSERFAANVASLGAEVLRCPRLDSPFDQDDDDEMPIEHRYARDTPDHVSKTFSVTWPFYRKNKPDLIIYDSAASSGLMVAENSAVTAIRMSNQFDYTHSTLGDPIIPLALRDLLLSFDKRLIETFKRQTSRMRNVFLDCKDATIFFYPSDLQLQGSTLASSAFYAARCILERPDIVPWKRLTPRNRPSLVIASSTTYRQDPQYYKACLAALSQSGWEIFLIVPSNSHVADFNSLPPNCYLLDNIPLVTILPHVDLLITGAGMATAMEAVYHGIPMLMLTSGHAELEAYGKKFNSCGLGIHLDQMEASPSEVAQRALRMRDDTQLKIGIRRLQYELRRSAGAEELCNWLEERVGLGSAMSVS